MSASRGEGRLRVLVHASQLYTGAGIRARGGRRVSEPDLGVIVDGAMVYSVKRVGGKEAPGRIVWLGESRELPARYRRLPKTDLRGKRAVIPGMIDCHTHLVFAGDRASEFAERCAGASYEEIAARGGGILSTVRATRAASLAQLERLAAARLREAYAFGVRTIEIKSGYGLSVESELKCLEVVRRLRARFPQLTLVPTFLGAHAFPPDRTREQYLRELEEEMLPAVAQAGLAEACDVFIDRGYYTVAEGERLLRAASRLGLKTKVHADELANTESAAFAARIGALSADHLLQVSEAGIRALAASQTVAVLLPTTALTLRSDHAPARKLLDAGACVAIATDFNPGTSMTLNLPVALTIAALYLGMSRTELLASVTYNAAKALGLESRKGTLEPGLDADFSILPVATFEEVYYRFAWAPQSQSRKMGL